MIPLGLEQLMEVLSISNLYRIECYDISNISGKMSVGSMVVFKNGIKSPNDYRKFKIKTVEGPNDYKSMEEVIERRFMRYISEQNNNISSSFSEKPDLVIMDGGSGQVNSCKKSLSKLGVSVSVIGLVKDDKHRTNKIEYNGIEIPLKMSSPLYRFLYSIQEEAHRFAITYHRSLRSKALKKSSLDNIEGVGPKRKMSLMKHFKTIDNIKKQKLVNY